MTIDELQEEINIEIELIEGIVNIECVWKRLKENIFHYLKNLNPEKS
ncbi:MAG: hypothetical protein HW406_2956 [Candidatus Brocadiaceae bacterium]|nr:hypothetical protein [Candidatus Brocadiaceae bacterium]